MGKQQNTNFILFGLTQYGFKPMIYSTWGENANHYTTDVMYFQLPYDHGHDDP